MAEQTDKQPRGCMQLWRDWLTESERQFNAFFNEVMGTEALARTVGGYMDVYAAFQPMLAQGMERYLSLMNMPTRNDIIGLGETLRAIEGRLARIEEAPQIAAAMVDGDEGVTAPRAEPPRTRRPAGVLAAEESRVEGQAIPEELRR